ncbi:MAG: transglutaminase family protein [Bacteroides sp.]|nr:transglutaminase family protein [Bacteroides sp.]
MKKYLYNYQTIIRFVSPVSRHFFHLRCMPCINACQQVSKRELFLHPADFLTHDHDTWGNPIQYGSRMEPHDSFVFVSSGEAILSPYCIPAEEDTNVFSVQSALTGISPQMKQFIMDVGEGNTPLERALSLSQALYEYMQYTPGSTAMDTTATEAFEQRKGVCQDYAHILIAMCRQRGIVARYVNGFLPGTGVTHAWVEVLTGDTWRGIDPTNNQLIEYGYIKLSHGRDAADCPVNRGVFTGTAMQQTEIRVIVEEI